MLSTHPDYIAHNGLVSLCAPGPVYRNEARIYYEFSIAGFQTTDSKLAVRVGFEPTEPVKVQRFSRPPDSTALAPHRLSNLPDFPIACKQRHNADFFKAALTVTILSLVLLSPLVPSSLTARVFAS